MDGFARYRWAWSLKLTTTERMLLLCYVHHADKQGWSFAGFKRLHELTGLGRSTMTRDRQRLADAGLIEVSEVVGRSSRVRIKPTALPAHDVGGSESTRPPRALPLPTICAGTRPPRGTITTQGTTHEQQQQETTPDAAADWREPKAPKDAQEWVSRQTAAHCEHRGVPAPADDADRARLTMKFGHMDDLGIERALRTAPVAIVLPCAIRASYETARMNGKLRNPGGATAKRVRELIAECRA